MRIAVSGSTGLIGSALVTALTADGHDVLRLVRRPSRRPDEVTWDPSAGSVDSAAGSVDPAAVDLAALAGTEAIVHLAGAPIGGRRWTEAYRREVRASRVLGTAAVARVCAALEPRPRVLVSGSATGWYGDTGERAVDETEPAGSGFLASVVRDWEAATAPAQRAGVRVVHARTGVVVAGEGGLLGSGVALPGGRRISLLHVFRLGIGGRLGSGRQWMSWISLADEIAGLRHLLTDDRLAGPVNLTAPEPVRNRDFTAALGRVLHRPAVVPVPATALRLAAGGVAADVLGSQRVLPRKLGDRAFRFRHPDIETALRAALDR